MKRGNTTSPDKPYGELGKLILAIANEQGCKFQADIIVKINEHRGAETGTVTHVDSSKMSRIATGEIMPDHAFTLDFKQALNLSSVQKQRLDAALEAAKDIAAANRAGGVLSGIDLTKEFVVVCDRDAVEPQMGDAELDWWGRLKWIGFHGGSHWLAVLKHEYPREQILRNVPPLVKGLLANAHFSLFASLGPGDGELDAQVLDQFNPCPTYVPIDIGMALLASTWKTLRGKEGIRIPFGVVGEFEEHFPYIAKRMRAIAKGDGIVYSLLGNTFGNLDKREASFIRNVCDQLRDQDYLLMHISCVDQVYNPEDDPLWQKVGPDLPHFQRFVAYAIERGRGTPVDQVIANWTTAVYFDKWESDLGPSAVAFAIYETQKRVPLQIICRYRLDGLKAWLEHPDRGMEVVASDEKKNDDRSLGTIQVTDGVLLLKKKQP